MLQLAQRTLAPSSPSVSISTAVWMVMCSDPVTRTPASGLPCAYFLRIDIRPGISDSATEISLRPQPACDMSATLNSVVGVATRVLMEAISFQVSTNLDMLIYYRCKQ